MKKVFLTVLFIICMCVSVANAENIQSYDVDNSMNCHSEELFAAYRPYYTYHRNIYAKPRKCCAKTRSSYRYAHNRDIIKVRTENRKHRRRTPKRLPTMVPYIKSENTQPISRFDKNYRIPQYSARRVSSGGITYYGTSNR